MQKEVAGAARDLTGEFALEEDADVAVAGQLMAQAFHIPASGARFRARKGGLSGVKTHTGLKRPRTRAGATHARPLGPPSSCSDTKPRSLRGKLL